MVAHRCFTEFIGCFTLALLGLSTAKFLLRYNPTSRIYRASIAAGVVFVTIWLVLALGGDPILNPVTAVMSHMKGKFCRSDCCYFVFAQVAGFVLGFVAFRYLLILMGEKND